MRTVVALLLAVLAATAQTASHERARQLLASGDAAGAAAIYRELVHSDPRNAGLLLDLSIAEYKAGQYSEAAASASAALKVDPNLTTAHLFLGAGSLETGDIATAIDSLQRFLRTYPGDRNARLMLGQAFQRAGRAEEAIEHLRAAAEMMPDNPRVWYALGQAYDTLGQKQAAAEAWTRLAQLPPSLESHIHAAQANDASRRWREAAAEWAEARKLAPDNTAVRLGFAWSLLRSRDCEASMNTLKPLLDKPGRADAQFVYGTCLVNLQQPEQAIPYLRAAVALDPKLTPAQAALGQALLQTGKPADAIPLLEAGLSTDQDGSTHFQLFRAYQLAHRTEDAQRALAAYRKFRATLDDTR